jgi:hypothetical protein
MKKILLCGLSLLLVSGLSFGQTFKMEYTADTTVGNFASVGTEVHVSNKIINLTNSPITIDWKMVGSDINNNGWAFPGFCDNNLCYFNATTLTNGVSSNPIDPMDTISTFYGRFDGDNAANNTASWIRIQAKDQANPLFTKTLTYVAIKGTLSTISVSRSEDDIVLYPNPAKNAVNIIYNSDLGVKNIGVYNLIGKAVNVYKVGNTSAKLDINDLPSGIYFLRLFDGQGRVVATRKLTHQ